MCLHGVDREIFIFILKITGVSKLFSQWVRTVTGWLVHGPHIKITSCIHNYLNYCVIFVVGIYSGVYTVYKYDIKPHDILLCSMWPMACRLHIPDLDIFGRKQSRLIFCLEGLEIMDKVSGGSCWSGQELKCWWCSQHFVYWYNNEWHPRLCIFRGRNCRRHKKTGRTQFMRLTTEIWERCVFSIIIGTFAMLIYIHISKY